MFGTAWFEFPEKQAPRAEQAAEKGKDGVEFPEEFLSG
jgi:hypothetical protein